MAIIKNAVSCCCNAPVNHLTSFDMDATVCTDCCDSCDYISTEEAAELIPESFPDEYFKLEAEKLEEMRKEAA